MTRALYSVTENLTMFAQPLMNTKIGKRIMIMGIAQQTAANL